MNNRVCKTRVHTEYGKTVYILNSHNTIQERIHTGDPLKTALKVTQVERLVN